MDSGFLVVDILKIPGLFAVDMLMNPGLIKVGI